MPVYDGYDVPEIEEDDISNVAYQRRYNKEYIMKEILKKDKS